MATPSLALSFTARMRFSCAPEVLQTLHTVDPTTLAGLGLQLLPYLEAVPDPRGRRGRRYALTALLVACLLGFCAGCQGYLSIARWARALPAEFLAPLGWSPGRTPCAATWLQLFRVLDWDAVAAQFHAWAEVACLPTAPPAPVVAAETPAAETPAAETPAAETPAAETPAAETPRVEAAWQGVAIDGKSLRGSLAAGSSTAHIVSVAVHGTGVSLYELGVTTKQNELTVAPELLAEVLGPGRVITGDALYTQRNLCTQIRAGKSHYLFVVKGNQETLWRQVQAVFQPVTAGLAQAQRRRSTETTEKAHGRIENRYLCLVPVTAAEVEWPGVAQVFYLERYRYFPARNGKPARESREVVYGITSLEEEEAGPEAVLGLQRGHWSIENQVHWVLDTLFREDERRLQEAQTARGVATLRRAALNLLSLLGGRSRAATRDRVRANPALLWPLIGRLSEN